MLSHYDVLEVAPEATEMEVRKQYQLLALKLHPDKPAGDHKKFTQLQEAWTVLADPHQRAEYDLQLKRDLLYQQYPISEELFLEDLHYSCDEETTNYSHVCRCGGRYSITEEELLSLIDSEVAVMCDNCSLAIIVVLPIRVQTNHVRIHDGPQINSESTSEERVDQEVLLDAMGGQNCHGKSSLMENPLPNSDNFKDNKNSLEASETSDKCCASEKSVQMCSKCFENHDGMSCVRGDEQAFSSAGSSKFSFDAAFVPEVETPSSSSPSSNSQSPEFSYLCPSPKSPLRSAFHS
ncbi:uncharacterized protein LOC108676702 [Hyalella azteca]|uniref:Uncharacterized protein LOC108676702 n=1 Tax=Hyalella azteca TaxID=294128 RepID=A0A8B7P2R0_HYAAZ|nr:uncharacterized protein LOC108676702 [Hyalella azteca]